MTKKKLESLPKITIVTPVKNSVTTLEKAIQSLKIQNYPNLEYIVLDGGSTDGTIDIIKKHQDFIDTWSSKDDGGNVMAYIEGIKKAQGEIIAFLNADDFYEPKVLIQAGEEFLKNPDLDLVSFRSRTIASDGKQYKTIAEASFKDMDLNKEKMIQVLGINARFFKKDVFDRLGFPTSRDDQGRAFLSNDLEYMIRFVLKGIQNKTIDYIGYNYLVHDNSLTFTKNYKNQIRLCEDKIFIAKKFLNGDLELPKFWNKVFKKWVKKYRSQIVKFNFKQKSWKEAIKNISLGIKEIGFFRFSFYLIKTLLRKNK